MDWGTIELFDEKKGLQIFTEALKRADASGNCIKHEFKDRKGYTK